MAQYGTPEEAEAMLDKAVVALKEDKTKTLVCSRVMVALRTVTFMGLWNASDGIFTAHPKLKGKQLKDLKGEKGFPLGKEIIERPRREDARGDLLVASAWLGQAARKDTFFTKVGDQICAVGYYK